LPQTRRSMRHAPLDATHIADEVTELVLRGLRP